MNRDDLIAFNETHHVYTVLGDKYTSVSSVIGGFFPEFNAEEVVTKVVQSPKMADPSYKYYGMTRQEILDKWSGKGKASRDKGNLTHDCIDKWMKGEPVTEYPIEFRFFLNFVEKFGFQPHRSEWRIFDEDFGVAGTADAVMKWRDDYILCDWKRSEEIKKDNKWECGFPPLDHLPNCNWSKYCLQLNTYKYILEKHYGIDIGAMRLVVLHPQNDGYRIHKVPDMQNDIINMLSAFQMSKAA